MRLTSLVLATALLATPTWADGSGDTHSNTDDIHTAAKINSIDGDTWNISHPPIPALKWPAMTMNFKVIDGTDTAKASVGDTVMVVLEEVADGSYGIKAVMPAE